MEQGLRLQQYISNGFYNVIGHIY